LDDTGELIR